MTKYVAICDDCGHRTVHKNRGGALDDLRRHDCETTRILRDLQHGGFAVTFTARDGWRICPDVHAETVAPLADYDQLASAA